MFSSSRVITLLGLIFARINFREDLFSLIFGLIVSHNVSKKVSSPLIFLLLPFFSSPPNISIQKSLGPLSMIVTRIPNKFWPVPTGQLLKREDELFFNRIRGPRLLFQKNFPQVWPRYPTNFRQSLYDTQLT